MEKKLRQSPLVIALYVISALLLVYTCYIIGSTISYVISYYSSYSMAPAAGETIAYVLQAAYQPLVSTILVFAAARILNEVRTLNPAYYATDEEIKAAKEAKKAAKAKKEEKTVEVETEAKTEEKNEAPKEEKKTAKKDEVKVDASMKKDELLAIADKMGIKVSSKATKADIIEAIKAK